MGEIESSNRKFQRGKGKIEMRAIIENVKEQEVLDVVKERYRSENSILVRLNKGVQTGRKFVEFSKWQVEGHLSGIVATYDPRAEVLEMFV